MAIRKKKQQEKNLRIYHRRRIINLDSLYSAFEFEIVVTVAVKATAAAATAIVNTHSCTRVHDNQKNANQIEKQKL